MKKAPIKNREVEYRVLDKECIIFLPAKGQFFKLNEVGTKIWRLIDGKRGEEEIADQIIKEFDAKEEKVKKDVKRYLSELKRKKMIM